MRDLALLCVACAALGANPIVPLVGMADPHMHVWPSSPSKVYLYSTHDCSRSGRAGTPCVANGKLGFNMRDWWVWSSTNLVDWTEEQRVKPQQISWENVNTSQECWATDAASFANGTTFFYLSVGPKQVGVVVGKTPKGPFKDPLGKPLVRIGLVPTYSRDPGVLMDDDGRNYLIFGTFNYFIAELAEDMISFVAKPTGVKINKEKHRDDKPFLHKHGGIYYLSWGCWYAMGSSPSGPFNYSGGVSGFTNTGFTTALANTSFAKGGGTKDRHSSFFTFHGQTYYACNDESHGGGGGFRSTIVAYVHYRANGTIAPVRIDETGVGNYNLTGLVKHKGWAMEAEDFYAISGGAVKRQKDASGPDPDLFEVANLTGGSSLLYPSIYSGNIKMGLSLLYSNGGTASGKVTVVAGGRANGGCVLAPTGGWGTYKSVSLGIPSRWGANVQTGMIKSIALNFSGGSAEFARIDALKWHIYGAAAAEDGGRKPYTKTDDAATPGAYTQHGGVNCFHGHGGVNIDSGKGFIYTLPQCKAFCDKTKACHCVVSGGNASSAGGCWRRSSCDPEKCEHSKLNTFIKPGGPAPPAPLSNCSMKSVPRDGCIFDERHNMGTKDCGKTSCEGQCCASCAAEPACTAWSHVNGFGRFACALYNGSGATGELRQGPSACTSAGKLPPPPTLHPPPARPPAAGAACKDCPNILLMFTDDQDLVLGGWEGIGWKGPMAQTRAAITAKGTTATQWRIHTPICAPSRAEMQSGRYYHNIKNDAPTPYWSVTSGAVGHLDLGKVWPQVFPKTLRMERGYTTALFGKCMNNDCGANIQAGGLNLRQMGSFDKWFEGTSYVNGRFYDNEAANCPGWPWPEQRCQTPTNTSTVGAGYLTSELGNRTIDWIRRVSAVPAAERRPWFVYFAPHAPHGPATPAPWYADGCKGVTAPRKQPNFNYTGKHTTSCSLYPPGAERFVPGADSEVRWWNGTDLPELTSCQPYFTEAEAKMIDAEARHRCQSLLSVDDSYVQILDAVRKLGQENNTFVLVSSDHGYNLGNHMLSSAKMQFYDHSLRIPMLFAGPGIKHGADLDFLGTQVDVAPTILGMAGIPTPSDMDGRSVLPLLVSEATAAAQGEGSLPGSVLRHLAATAAAPPPPPRLASFHTYYNQGPWQVGAPHRLDDWSNTWIGLHYTAKGKDLKYGEFDPWGKQSGFAKPYMFALFDLKADPYELENVYNATKATANGAALLAELHELLARYNTCAGPACP